LVLMIRGSRCAVLAGPDVSRSGENADLYTQEAGFIKPRPCRAQQPASRSKLRSHAVCLLRVSTKH